MNKIQFTSSKAINITLSENKTVENPADSFELQTEVGYSDKGSDIFIIKFTLKLIEEAFKLNVIYEAVFKTDEKITKEFKDSHFPKVNAPAIAYPFLRSFISTLTLNAGLNAIIIPTINFQALANKDTPTN